MTTYYWKGLKMITKPVKISKWKNPDCVDGFEYVVTATNGAGVAIMCQKGKRGLKNAQFIKQAINEYLAID